MSPLLLLADATSHPKAPPQIQPNRKSSGHRRRIKTSFPHKLAEVIQMNEHNAILKWLPGGKAFIIMDRERFTTKILPKYFKQAKFESFTRKLHRWKFVRVPGGPFKGAFYHKLFRRDHHSLCNLMSCSDNNDISLAAMNISSRQEAVDLRAMPNIPANMSVPQQNAFRGWEEMNMIATNIRHRRAMFEHQQRIIMNPKANYNAANMHNTPARSDAQAFERSCMMDYNTQMPQIGARLYQTGMVHQLCLAPVQQTHAELMIQRQQQIQARQQMNGQQFTAQRSNNNMQCYRASAA